MSFATDSFTGTQFQELAAYSGSWSKQTGYTQDLILGVGGTYVICNSASIGVYQHSASPASADYSVFANIAKLSGATNPEMAVVGRAAAAADTYYFLQYSHASTVLRLFKRVAGVSTQLGSSFTMTLTSTPVQIELRMAGDQISGYADGVLRIGPVTDTTITGAGKAGIRLVNTRESGVADSGSLDNFDAVDATVPSAIAGGVTLDNAAAGGTLSVSASDIGGGVTLADALAGGSGLGMQSGIVSALALRNWSGSLQTSVTIPVVTVCRLSDGVQVLTLTSQTTHASTGDLTITSASLLVGTWYMVVGWNADGSSRFAVPLQATA